MPFDSEFSTLPAALFRKNVNSAVSHDGLSVLSPKKGSVQPWATVLSTGGATLIRTYETQLSPEEVSDRIKKEIDTVGAFYYLLPSKRGREFVGNVSSQKFYVHVRHGGRASFAPRLIGRIEPTPTGSRVVVDMRVDPLVRRLVVFMLAAAVVIAVLPYLLTGSNPIVEGAGVIVLGILFIYLISLPAGRREGQRLQELMDRLFLVSPSA